MADTELTTRWCCSTCLWVCDHKGQPASQQESGEDDGGHVFQHRVNRRLRPHGATTDPGFLDWCCRRRGAIIHATVIHLLNKRNEDRLRMTTHTCNLYNKSWDKRRHKLTSSTFLSVVGGMTLPWLRGKLSGNFSRTLVWASRGVSWCPGIEG